MATPSSSSTTQVAVGGLHPSTFSTTNNDDLNNINNKNHTTNNTTNNTNNDTFNSIIQPNINLHSDNPLTSISTTLATTMTATPPVTVTATPTPSTVPSTTASGSNSPPGSPTAITPMQMKKVNAAVEELLKTPTLATASRLGSEIADIPAEVWGKIMRIAPHEDTEAMKKVRRKTKNRCSAKRSTRKRLQESIEQNDKYHNLESERDRLLLENYDLKSSLDWAFSQIRNFHAGQQQQQHGQRHQHGQPQQPRSQQNAQSLVQPPQYTTMMQQVPQTNFGSAVAPPSSLPSNLASHVLNQNLNPGMNAAPPGYILQGHGSNIQQDFSNMQGVLSGGLTIGRGNVLGNVNPMMAQTLGHPTGGVQAGQGPSHPIMLQDVMVVQPQQPQQLAQLQQQQLQQQQLQQLMLQANTPLAAPDSSQQKKTKNPSVSNASNKRLKTGPSTPQ